MCAKRFGAEAWATWSEDAKYDARAWLYDYAHVIADHFDALAAAGVRQVSSGIAAKAIREVVNAE